MPSEIPAFTPEAFLAELNQTLNISKASLKFGKLDFKIHNELKKIGLKIAKTFKLVSRDGSEPKTDLPKRLAAILTDINELGSKEHGCLKHKTTFCTFEFKLRQLGLKIKTEYIFRKVCFFNFAKNGVTYYPIALGIQFDRWNICFGVGLQYNYPMYKLLTIGYRIDFSDIGF